MTPQVSYFRSTTDLSIKRSPFFTVSSNHKRKQHAKEKNLCFAKRKTFFRILSPIYHCTYQ